MKKAEFNFVWLFAIIVGTAILILAIYGVIKFSNTSRLETDTKLAKEISILTDPMQAGIAEGKVSAISFNQEIKINNICSDFGFGKNSISVSTKSGIGKEWIKSGISNSVVSKYIFSFKEIQGKKYIILSKPFKFPYKISDLTIIIESSENYCFDGFEGDLKQDLESLNLPNIQIDNCTIQESKKICFGSGDCDIIVSGDENSGTVTKEGKTVYYVGNLMYAAIFSDEEIYKCNVKRLMYRTGKIAEELSEKSDLMNSRNCNTNLNSEIISWKSSIINASESDLLVLEEFSKKLESKNDKELCGLWS